MIWRRISRALRRLGRRPLLENVLTSGAFLAGLGLISYGCALVALPAGLIVGGVLLAAGAVLYARGEG